MAKHSADQDRCQTRRRATRRYCPDKSESDPRHLRRHRTDPTIVDQPSDLCRLVDRRYRIMV